MSRAQQGQTIKDGLSIFLEEDKEDKKETSSNLSDARTDDTVYKKWFRTKSHSGFFHLREWFDAGKVVVDIGEVRDESLSSNTQVWVNAVEIATYLRAVTNGQAERLYPKRASLPTAESFIYYGGTVVEGDPISRIVKIHYWGSKDNHDETAFCWKTGHFVARRNESGAFVPDMSKVISSNLIKVTRTEMAEASYRLDLSLVSFAAQADQFLASLNGSRR